MWVKVAAGTAVVAVAIVLVFYVTHLPSLTISEVDVAGTNLVSAEDVQALAREKLNGSYAYLVPHANSLFAPVAAIASAIKNTYPPVAGVSISRKSMTALAIVVTERQAAALWCAGVLPGEISADGNVATSSASAASGCYLMDSSGFIYTKAPSEEGFTRFYGTIVGNPIGALYLSGDFASLEKTVAGIGESISRTPDNVLVDNGGTDVSITFSEGGVLRFARTNDSQVTLQNVASVFASQSFKDHPDFEYVDFRFGDKVYVKFR